MADHKENHFVPVSNSPVNQDRCTVVITTHYQEWDPANTTHTRIAYDRTLAPECVPHQTTIRVNPGKRTKLEIGGVDPERCELALAHDVPRMQADTATNESLKEAQKANTIKITNADGVKLGMIYPNRGGIFHFGQEVWAEATHTTAILRISAFPA